ncbi:MAG: cyanophycin synthetase [Bacteroidales bacterium]|nr:cyanophycin synthetase [Bacteroidales bacterium]
MQASAGTHILQGLRSFEGLPHRLEYAGTVNGILFYNDAISTVPEATIQALKTLQNTHTLILGGYDRKINYGQLYQYLRSASVKQIIFTGPAGKRMQKEYQGPQTMIILDDMQQIADYSIKHTPSGKVCLLSPAAASYDRYKNFEERGDTFRRAITQK